MAGFSTNKVFGIYLRESADDGSDFGTPAADYRFVYLGEDGNWHAKDASNVVTTLGGGAGALDLSALTSEVRVQPISDYLAAYDASAADERGIPAWVLQGGGGRQGSSFFDECVYRLPNTVSDPVYAGGLNTNVSGTLAAVSDITGEAAHPGVVSLTTGTGTTGRARITSSSAATPILLAGGKVRFGVVAKLPTLSDVTNTYTVRMGLGSNGTGDSTDGVYFRYTNGVNSGKWEGVTRSASSETARDTTITADVSWHTYEFEVNAAGTSVQFYIDGAAVGAAVTTNIPSAGFPITPASIVKSAGGTARTLSLDAYWYSFELTTAR